MTAPPPPVDRPGEKAAIEAAAEAIYAEVGPESIDDDGAETLAQVALAAAYPIIAAALADKIAAQIDAEWHTNGWNDGLEHVANQIRSAAAARGVSE